MIIATDIRKSCTDELEANGGKSVRSARAVAEQCNVVLVSLNNEAAFHAVTGGPDGILAANRAVTVVDTCTLAIVDKREAADKLSAVGAILLDFTVSGTRAVVLAGDLTLYASGDEASFRKAEEPLKSFTRSRTFLGEFGNASKLNPNHPGPKPLAHAVTVAGRKVATLREARAHMLNLRGSVRSSPHWTQTDALLLRAVESLSSADVEAATTAFERALEKDHPPGGK